LAHAWAERGDSVTLVPTFSGKGECFYPISEKIHFVWLADLVSQRDRGLKSYWNRFWRLRRLIRESRADVVVSFLPNVNVAAILTTRGLGIPMVVCERLDPSAEDKTKGTVRALRRLTYPWADLVTVQTENAIEPFRALVPGIKQLSSVPNPLPPDLPSAPYTVPSRHNGRKVLASMGRLVAQKQFSLLIEIFSKLSNSMPDWDLCIWGEGPLRAELEKQVTDLELEGRVILPGRTSNPWQSLLSADAFVLTSAFEGFPNVLLEAMALGLPSASFDCPSGPKELSRDGQDAVLVPPGDCSAMEQALRKIMGDEEFRRELGQRAVTVRERYSQENIIAAWDELFSGLMAHRHSSTHAGVG
jgi:glycosyltransferase involved in cell wall biosynthesis